MPLKLIQVGLLYQVLGGIVAELTNLDTATHTHMYTKHSHITYLIFSLHRVHCSSKYCSLTTELLLDVA